MAFAAIIAIFALAVAAHLHTSRGKAFAFVGISAASHGVLDIFTNGGMGVALWWPWSTERFFAPWQVIEVSPLSFRRIVSAKGIEVLQSELLWVWLPALAV